MSSSEQRRTTMSLLMQPWHVWPWIYWKSMMVGLKPTIRNKKIHSHIGTFFTFCLKSFPVFFFHSLLICIRPLFIGKPATSKKLFGQFLSSLHCDKNRESSTLPPRPLIPAISQNGRFGQWESPVSHTGQNCLYESHSWDTHTGKMDGR